MILENSVLRHNTTTFIVGLGLNDGLAATEHKPVDVQPDFQREVKEGARHRFAGEIYACANAEADYNFMYKIWLRKKRPSS